MESSITSSNQFIEDSSIDDLSNNFSSCITASESNVESINWMKGFKYTKKGGLLFIDEEILKKQQGVIKDVMLQAGSQLLSGKSIVNLSLPIRLFEPRSTLERIAESWSYGPSLLSKASISKDPLEKMKYVVAFALGGLHLCVGQYKPFNPILGETYEAKQEDGTKIYMEHISHHPPRCAFYVVGPNQSYIFSGIYELASSLRSNAITNYQIGEAKIIFSDCVCIKYTMPQMKISGIMFGDRHIEWIGDAKFIDENNGLIGNFIFNPEKTKVFSKEPSDVIIGKISQINNGDLLSKAKGSWLKNIQFDTKIYFDIENEKVSLPIPVETPVPSDSRYRNDLISLKNGDSVQAQTEKLELEAIQRNDKKLRSLKEMKMSPKIMKEGITSKNISSINNTNVINNSSTIFTSKKFFS